MTAASDKTSTIPARTVAALLLLPSRWPRSCWITRWECWGWKGTERANEGGIWGLETYGEKGLRGSCRGKWSTATWVPKAGLWPL